MASLKSLLTKQVFVAGRLPDVTYNPRDEQHLEREVRSYLDQGPGRALSVCGPTKSGKTVLIERLLPQDEVIWMQGSDIDSVDSFWNSVVDWLGLYDMVEITTETGTSGGIKVGGEAGIPGFGKVSAQANGARSNGSATKISRQHAITTVARDGLKTLNLPIVIDDFHYVPEDAKQAIARAIKTVIPWTSVVMIAVPHQAFDAVRAEGDMNGRVSQLSIEEWSAEELEYIAARGFEALRITGGEDVARVLAENSYGAPFLMQELCYEYATSIGVVQTLEQPTPAPTPPSWKKFFQRVANRKRPMIFEDLLRGPKTRGQERIDRIFHTGRKTDIYGAVLYAIGESGPVKRIKHRHIARTLERELIATVHGQQISSALGQMSLIAEKKRGTGDPALAYRDDEVFILDPFLCFYLKYGSWEIDK